jgi:adenine-specific DNA methylase
MPKYIEKSFPIGILSQLAERESWRKEIYRPVYYIHKWWARRLGSIFRGIILAACKEEHENLLQDYYSFNNFPDITIFDPFMGSGVTIGEAAKLGCKVIGRDINPVSSSIVLAALSPYRNSDVEKTYKTIEKKLKKRIQTFYKTKLANGTITDVLYYFQVKTLNCPACKKHIDLFLF